MNKRVVITGAFSYTGAAVACELLRRGYEIHTLTNRQPFSPSKISFAPLRFEFEHLKKELCRADVFINTYWVRFPYSRQSFTTAVANSKMLIDAAIAAGVKRIIQISVSNAQDGMNLGYYAGKAKVDDYVHRCPIPFAIVRPTLVVGEADVLTNNIVWLLRHFPIFLIPGNAEYRLQPITLHDTACIISEMVEDQSCKEIDAAGPDIMSFRDYVRLVARACHLKRPIISVPEGFALGFLQLIQPLLRDIILTREELLGLKQELLISHKAPLGKESIADWLKLHGNRLGYRYVNDIKRHFGQDKSQAVYSIDEFGRFSPT